MKFRINVIIIKIPFGFVRLLGPRLWVDVSRYEKIARKSKASEQEVSSGRFYTDKCAAHGHITAPERPLPHSEDVH